MDLSYLLCEIFTNFHVWHSARGGKCNKRYFNVGRGEFTPSSIFHNFLGWQNTFFLHQSTLGRSIQPIRPLGCRPFLLPSLSESICVDLILKEHTHLNKATRTTWGAQRQNFLEKITLKTSVLPVPSCVFVFQDSSIGPFCHRAQFWCRAAAVFVILNPSPSPHWICGAQSVIVSFLVTSLTKTLLPKLLWLTGHPDVGRAPWPCSDALWAVRPYWDRGAP